jgi:glycerol-3-phosphate acyltransferase PlsY
VTVVALMLLLLLAYLTGAIPIGVLVARRYGVDPRDVGSGNIGTANVIRAAGFAAGALTFAGDAAKGLVPVVIAKQAGYGTPALALTALAAFLGHLYSCFLSFQGGKGVATALGALLGLAPAAMGIVLPLFLGTVVLTRYVSLASIVAAAATPLVLIALDYERPIVVVGLMISALIILRHRDNIRRLRFGTEARLGVRRTSTADSGVA